MTYWEAVGYIGIAMCTGTAFIAFGYAVEGITKWCSRGRR